MNVGFAGSFVKLNLDPGFYQCLAVSSMTNYLMNSAMPTLQRYLKVQGGNQTSSLLNINTNRLSSLRRYKHRSEVMQAFSSSSRWVINPLLSLFI